ncbi:MAG: discoidin domain-containing protein, partial [Phycisphaeraceae bacterium]|nr:discoidin domain-containing protein [Phycisphaeraceae bacterium]
PAAGAEDVVQNVTLAWAAGENPGTHTLYFGETLADIDEATPSSPLGVLRSQEQSELTYQIAERLEFAKTYYWRVDEVNATPDGTVFKGPIWQFTTEPYAVEIPAATMAVTASSASNEFSTPEKTIDGSGLGGDESHAIAPETMWFTAAVDLDPWIQYEFDSIKKLDTMKIWNSNSSAEMAIGWGVKDVVIEYSVDGENWDALQDVTQLGRASGLPSYNDYDAIAFNGVAAKQVRLNIQSNWGGLLLSYGLSEVKFSMIRAQARTPDPASGSVDVHPSTVVHWRAGRQAAQHTIYVSGDASAVADESAPSVTSIANSLDLSSLDLELGKTTYWRVDEVNEADAVPVWAGPVWSLTTSAALTVDDFESYSNLSPDRPFQHWLDGFGYSADEFFTTAYGGNGTGSGTGHDIWSLSSPQYQGDIMESTLVVDGSGQSMPVYYDNASGASHVDHTFAAAQDWTTHGVQTLGLSFFGHESNGGQLYLEINGVKVAYDLDADAIKQAEWHFWAIDLASVGVNLQAVTSLSIGIEGAGSGVVDVDDIALYSNEVQYIEPVQPGTENLVAQYLFEGNYGDSSGQGNTLTEVGDVAILNDSERGNVAVFNGLNAALQVPVIGDGTTSELTITTWFRLDVEHTGALWSIFHNEGWSAGDVHAHISQNAQFSMGVNGSGSDLRSTTSATVGQWYHLAYVAGPEAVSLYINGILSQSSTGNPDAVLSLGEGTLGAWSNGAMERFIGGSMDDVRIYTKVLSAEEIAGIAGRTIMYKPF